MKLIFYHLDIAVCVEPPIMTLGEAGYNGMCVSVTLKQLTVTMDDVDMYTSYC